VLYVFLFCRCFLFASIFIELEVFLIIHCFRAYSRSSESAVGHSSYMASLIQYHFCTASVEFEFKASYASDHIISTPKYSALGWVLDGERLDLSTGLVKQKYGGLALVFVYSASPGQLLDIQSLLVNAATPPNLIII